VMTGVLLAVGGVGDGSMTGEQAVIIKNNRNGAR